MYIFIKKSPKVSRFFKNMLVLVCLVTLVSTLHACNPVLTEPISVTGYKLNTYVTVSAYTLGSHKTDEVYAILNQTLTLCDYYENLFSRTLSDSILYKINNQETNIVPAELAELIRKGIYYGELSNGAFDITIGSVSSLWDFTAKTPTVPDKNDIEQALQYVDYTNIKLTDNSDGNCTISMPRGTIIDLGAIAKGYIADKIKDLLVSRGIDKAVINLGGNILCVGNKQNNRNFNIAIKNPFSENGTPLVTLSLNNKSAVSSGTYERYFYENDTFYHHILNSDTGYPCDNELTGVTIISDASVDGDCLSTVCFALGTDKGMKLIEETDGVEALFLTNDGNVQYSSGFSSYIKN